MNLTQISTFRAVMTSRSLTEAARKMGRTQPAVSLAIKSLEDDLGLKLFERRGRRLIPVPEAAYLLSEAETILDHLDTVSRTMRTLAGGGAGTLRVAAMPGPAAHLFPRFLAETIPADAGIRISVSSRSSPQIQELVSAQSIDFGFGDAPRTVTDNARFTTRAISAACFCAVPRDHPLASRKRLSWHDLDGVPMGTMQQGHPHAEMLAQRFITAKAGFDRAVESQTFLPLIQFVGAGHCVAVVDPLTVVTVGMGAQESAGVVFRELVDPIRYEYALIFPRYRPSSQLAHNLAEAWMNHLRDLLDDVEALPEVEAESTVKDE